METIQHVRKTDLARNTRKIIRDVLRGQTAVIESHGQPEVAIVDVTDYYLQRAALAYFTQPDEVNLESGLTEQAVELAGSEQERHNLVLACYLGEAISLARAAELLTQPVLDLRMRFVRLGIPLRLGVESALELEEDVRNALSMTK